jgi:thymidylate kinase
MGCRVQGRRILRFKEDRPSQKIVIFDSPDGTGKTNIAQGLSFDLKIPYFRMGSQHENWRKGRFKEALEFDQTYISEFLRQTRTDVIIDRAYPSEWVYSQVYGRETNQQVLEQVDAQFARMGAYIVIPLRHDYSDSRKDEVVDVTDLPKLHQAYLKFRKWTRCPTITIYVDSYGNDLKREIEAIRPELNFDRDKHGFALNVTLDLMTEKKDISDIFKDPRKK